jgi:hypothetical protein
MKFVDEVNPTPDELRTWLYSRELEPMEDFDLMLDEQHRCVLLDATADADCPKASWADRVLQRLNVEAKRHRRPRFATGCYKPDVTYPDLRGRRVRIAPANHPEAGKEGVIADQQPCEVCKAKGWPDCGYADLIVRLDNGHYTRIYEPDAEILA